MTTKTKAAAPAATTTLTIHPVSRIEGHAKITIRLDERGEVVGFDIDLASKRFDLSTLETVALPLHTTTAS